MSSISSDWKIDYSESDVQEFLVYFKDMFPYYLYSLLVNDQIIIMIVLEFLTPYKIKIVLQLALF